MTASLLNILSNKDFDMNAETFNTDELFCTFDIDSSGVNMYRGGEGGNSDANGNPEMKCTSEEAKCEKEKGKSENHAFMERQKTEMNVFLQKLSQRQVLDDRYLIKSI